MRQDDSVARGRPVELPWVIGVARLILRPLFMMFGRRDWTGDDKLPDGGWVMAVNHTSKLDPLMLGHWMLDHGLSPKFLIKDSLFALPVIGWLLRQARQIPVHRAAPGAAEALRAAEEAVQQGYVVTIYPEGTITRDPQMWPMTGKTGAVRLAHLTGRPLVPVMQWGPHLILAPYAHKLKVFPLKTVHVRVGDPLDLSWLPEQPTHQQFEHATERLMAALTELEAQVRGELPPAVPFRATLGRKRRGGNG